MIFMADNNVSFPGSESMKLDIAPDGRAVNATIVKANTKNAFSNDAQGVVNDLQEAPQVDVSKVKPDPFLVDDFQNIVKQTGTGIGSASEAAKKLTQEQRVALAGGDLDQAIALGNRRV